MSVTPLATLIACFSSKGLSAPCTPFQFLAGASDSGDLSSLFSPTSSFSIPVPAPGGCAAARLPGVRANAGYSLGGIAEIKGVAVRVREAPPDCAAAAGPDLLQDPPQSLPGELPGLQPWLWPPVDRGHGPPHACPGAPTSALCISTQPWIVPAKPRVWIQRLGTPTRGRTPGSWDRAALKAKVTREPVDRRSVSSFHNFFQSGTIERISARS